MKYKAVFVVKRIPYPGDPVFDVRSTPTYYDTYQEAEAEIASYFEHGSDGMFGIDKIFVPTKETENND